MLLFTIVAFVGGILSVLSPCSGVLLPSYFALITDKKDKFFYHTLVFSIGVLLVSLPIGIGSAVLFSILLKWGDIIFKLVGILFLFLAIISLLSIKITFPKVYTYKHSSSVKSFMLGIFSALSIGTCAGPIIGAIATLAGTKTNLIYASYLMFIYTLGIVFPFLLLSLSAQKYEFLRKIFVKGKLYKFTILTRTFHIHSTNILNFVLMLSLAIIYLFFGGSLLGFENYIKIDTSIFLDFQDKLLNLIY